MKRFLCALMLVVGMAGRVYADAAQDPFTVTRIHVDKSAASSDEARKQAVVEAEKQAFDLLMARLTFDEDQKKVDDLKNDPSLADLSPYVKALKFDNEVVSPVRYSADIDVSFQSEPIKKLLTDRDIAFSLLQSRPVVVVPIYWDGAAYHLWEEDNPWLKAWQAFQSQSGLIPIVVPKGDANDQAFTVDDATNRNAEALARLAERYQTTESMIVVGSLKTEDGRQQLLVSYARFGAAIEDSKVSTDSLTIGEGESPEVTFARGVGQVYDRIQEDWKRQSVANRYFQESIEAKVIFKELKEWNDIKARLSKVAGIDSFEVSQFSRGSAYIYIRQNGTLNQLQIALAQQDLILQTVGNEVFLRRLTQQ